MLVKLLPARSLQVSYACMHAIQLLINLIPINVAGLSTMNSTIVTYHQKSCYVILTINYVRQVFGQILRSRRSS